MTHSHLHHAQLIVMSLSLTLLFTAGCASSTMQTQRQLEKGDLVFSGAADWPGFLFIAPRFSGQLTYGFGAGDVSVHAGTMVSMINAGGSVKGYLGDSINARLELDVNTLWGAEWLLFGSFQLTNAVRKKTGLYGGLHIATMGILRYGPTFPNEYAGATAGGVFGLDMLIRDNLGLQLNIIWTPLYIDQTLRPGAAALPPFGVPSDASSFEGPGIFGFQFGVGLYGRRPATPQLTPSETAPQWSTKPSP